MRLCRSLACPRTCTSPTKIHPFGQVQVSSRILPRLAHLSLFRTSHALVLYLAALPFVLPKSMSTPRQPCPRPEHHRWGRSQGMPAPPCRMVLCTCTHAAAPGPSRSNRYSLKLELSATSSKQTTVVLSNRHKKPPGWLVFLDPQRHVRAVAATRGQARERAIQADGLSGTGAVA